MGNTKTESRIARLEAELEKARLADVAKKQRKNNVLLERIGKIDERINKLQAQKDELVLELNELADDGTVAEQITIDEVSDDTSDAS